VRGDREMAKIGGGPLPRGKGAAGKGHEGPLRQRQDFVQIRVAHQNFPGGGRDHGGQVGLGAARRSARRKGVETMRSPIWSVRKTTMRRSCPRDHLRILQDFFDAVT